MKLTVGAKELGRALMRVRGVTEHKNTIPILSHMMLTAEDGQFVLATTDLDIWMQETIAADIAERGVTTVDTHRFTDVIRKLPDGAEVSLSQDGPTAPVIVKSGRSKFSLLTLSPADYPIPSTSEFPTKFDLPAKDLRGLLHETQFAISTEETRYYLNGIYFHPFAADGNRAVLRAVATDGHRLAQSQITAPVPALGEALKFDGIIIPRKAIGELSKLLEKADGVATVEISNTKARFTLGGVAITTKLIDGTFPDYARVVPRGNKHRLRVDKTEFRNAVDRVQTISSERGRAVKMTLTKDRMVLSVRNPDTGEATEELAVDYSGDDIEIGFNTRYLLDMAAHMEAGLAEFMLEDAGSPTLIRTADELDTLFVLMPMRV